MFRIAKKKPVKIVTEVVAEIHNSFETASDLALAQAKNIISKNIIADNKKELSEILVKSGFSQAKLVTEVTKAKKAAEMSESRAKIIEHFAVKYPQYKFIFEDQVIEICKKYNLILGPVSQYKGDVPEKNIREIANFKVKEEDTFYIIRSAYSLKYDAMISGKTYAKRLEEENKVPKNSWTNNMYVNHNRSSKILKVPFSICAPASDMDTEGHKVKDFKLTKDIPDPIVLHRVHTEGYLIVSKWGPEGQDPSLINEISN